MRGEQRIGASRKCLLDEWMLVPSDPLGAKADRNQVRESFKLSRSGVSQKPTPFTILSAWTRQNEAARNSPRRQAASRSMNCNAV